MKPSKWKILETWNNYIRVEIYLCVYYCFSFYVSMFEYGNSVHQKWVLPLNWRGAGKIMSRILKPEAVQPVNKNQDLEIFGDSSSRIRMSSKHKQNQGNRGEWTPNPDRGSCFHVVHTIWFPHARANRGHRNDNIEDIQVTTEATKDWFFQSITHISADWSSASQVAKKARHT